METVPDKIRRAHHLLEEAVSIIEEVSDNLGTDLNTWSSSLLNAARHGRWAAQHLKARLQGV